MSRTPLTSVSTLPNHSSGNQRPGQECRCSKTEVKSHRRRESDGYVGSGMGGELGRYQKPGREE